MAISDDLNKRLNAQWDDVKPTSDEPVDSKPEAKSGWEFGKSIENASEDLGARMARGVRGGDELIKAGIYGVTAPFIPEGQGKGAELARRVLMPVGEWNKKTIEDRSAHPKTAAGKVLGGAAEGVGGMMTMPMGGGIARNIIAGIGMGEGADISKNVLGGIFNYFGGEKYRDIGEKTGSVLGGGVGSQLNVTRMKMMGEVGSQVLGGVKSIVPAYQSARAKQAAGDTRKLWTIFSDEFGSLRAQTRGIAQEFTNRSLAAVIQKDIRASEMSENFTKDMQLTGIDTKPWGLGERTMVPTLTETIAKARPESYAQASSIAGRAKAMQKTIVDAYNKMVSGAKVPTSPEGITASAKTFQSITQAKVDALSVEEGTVKKQFTKLDSAQEFQVGEEARGIRDRMRDNSFAVASDKYRHAEQMADAEGLKIPSGGVREEGKEILRDFYSQVDPKKVPPVVRTMLGATQAEKSGLILPEEIAQEKDAAGKALSLKDANDLAKAFNEAASNAKAAENFTAFSRAKSLEKEVLGSIESSKASPETKAAYSEARRYWAEEHAPRFQEGLGKALGKERTGVYEGREALKSEKFIDSVLSGETSIREAETTFGSGPELKRILKVGLEDKFSKEVFSKPFTNQRMFEANLDAYKKKYASALERMPEVADKIDQASAKMLSLQNEKKMEMDRYKDIMGSPITKAVGPIQAKEMFQSALADPLKMEQLLKATKGTAAKDLIKEVFQQGHPFKNGEYDPDGLLDMVRAGKRTADSPSSMELLFSAAFGPKEAKRHIATLEAIANFTKRQAATDPKYLQAGSLLSDSPVQQATGQRMASWISAWRAQAAGNTSSTYVLTLGLSRFANAKVQNAIENAKRNALYDPDTANAILEMVAKPSTEPLSMTTAKKIFGDIRMSDGKRILDRLIDRGYVKDYVSRGLIYGAEKTAQDESDPTNRSTARRLRQNDDSQ